MKIKKKATFVVPNALVMITFFAILASLLLINGILLVFSVNSSKNRSKKSTKLDDHRGIRKEHTNQSIAKTEYKKAI